MAELYYDRFQRRQLCLCDTQSGCIAARLAGIGVQYQALNLPAVAFDADAERDEIIGNYLEPLNVVLQRMPSATLDVTSVLPTHPRLHVLKRRFMTEHSHDTAEAQLMVWGHGVLFMRAGEDVWALRCQAADFVCLPPGMMHWFEFDEQVGFRTVRVFEHAATPRRVRRGRDMRGRYQSLPRSQTAHAS